jgi:hypothetical protein
VEASNSQLLLQRLRNLQIDCLELAASYEAQRAYQVAAPLSNVGNELVNQWDDVAQTTFEDPHAAQVYTTEEIRQLHHFQSTLEIVVDETPSNLPAIEELQQAAIWKELRDAASAALNEMMIRGRFSENGLEKE